MPPIINCRRSRLRPPRHPRRSRRRPPPIVSPRSLNFLLNPVRRVLFFAAAAGAASFAAAQSAPARPAPKFLGSQPDQTEGAKILAGFRNVGIQGDYWLKFDLRVMPRKGDERRLEGEMFGAQGPDGPLTKLLVDDLGNKGGSHLQLYLLKGGRNQEAWEWNHGQRGITPSRVEDDGLLASVQGTDLTLFDLQMPFLHWTDFIYEGVANVRGRPAHAFLLYPPTPLEIPANENGTPPAAVRVFLDTQFSAMTQAEWLDAAGKPLKTITVLDLKKTGEQWIVKSIDLRNHRTRAKTRFALTAAALGLSLPPETFDPQRISHPNPPVPADKVERF
ncbi:MAG: hypothetical protein C0518_03420 [Opitutus sp.]|nr:hypothetical protein [Opitutus sp.]